MIFVKKLYILHNGINDQKYRKKKHKKNYLRIISIIRRKNFLEKVRFIKRI